MARCWTAIVFWGTTRTLFRMSGIFAALLLGAPRALAAQESMLDARSRSFPEQRGSGPRLAVLLTVDQLGQDLLARYAHLYSGGLRRLLDRGRWYTNAWVDHGVTVSHPGHVTLSTGLDPARHGIVDAAFYQLAGEGTRRFVDAVLDSSERILGEPTSPGASPRQIRAPGIWDWVLDTDSTARRVAVGTGRYSSLLYARTPGDVYWFSPLTPGYVTSTFYRNAYPDWVSRFNRNILPRFLADTVWNLVVPDSIRHLARRDDTPYETRGRHPSFPHRFHVEVPAANQSSLVALADWISDTPAIDEATLAFAQEAVQARRLGQRASTDLLIVVLSQVDDIGHWYGPRSLEQFDNLLRLDAALERFFTFLDEQVGTDRWALALSADHAAPAAPEHRVAAGEPAVRVMADAVHAALSAAARAATGDSAGSADRIAAALERFDWVADAMTPAELVSKAPADSFVVLYRRSTAADRVPRYPLFSFESGRSGPIAGNGIAVRLRDNAMLDLDVSVHGSPYEYDRHVPIVLLARGISPGTSAVRATTKDLAPTLAAMAGLLPPPALDGRVLDVGNYRLGAAPEARAHHQLVYHAADRRTYLVGGSTPWGEAHQHFNEIWSWDGGGWLVTDTLPFPRSSHRVVYHAARNSIVLFGGGSNRTFAADSTIWEWRNDRWTSVGTSHWGGRAEPGLCYDERRQRVIGFGGWDAANKLSDALWEWTGDSVVALKARGPSPRAGHVFVYDPARERCLLVGGRGEQGFETDVWEWDGLEWNLLSAASPSARWFSGAATDYAGARVIVFGGSGPDGDLGDTWAWDGERWSLIAKDGPIARGMARLAFDGSGVLLFGGRRVVSNGSRDLADVWQLRGRRWVRIR
jgi:hypothetical protein